ncbi:MAG: allophanate hydrolase subunit 1 [Nocardioidaceae bacterium]|nr:allophanate hydrolase subunit 1 [Nocardioidaceae bacterium]
MVRPFGTRAVLVELAGPADVLRLRAAVESAGVATETVPGWRTLLVRTDGDPTGVAEWLKRAELGDLEPPPQAQPVIIDVRYDGPDLEDVAQLMGKSVEEVVALHTRPEYTVVMLGFSRGFPYLSGMEPALTGIPRLATPRTRVPAGAVGIALDQTGIYPMASPGGWRLLGNTDAVLFDPERWPPSPLQSGSRLRLRAVGWS